METGRIPDSRETPRFLFLIRVDRLNKCALEHEVRERGRKPFEEWVTMKEEQGYI